jgi:hypothetical protein
LSAPIVFQQSGNILACFTGLLLLAAASPAAAAPPTDFPYRATVIGDDAVVRSGPGETHYGTDRLAAGSEVEVYRHDPGGWMAIRPPAGSFSLVRRDEVELLPDGLARVSQPDTLAWVGTRLNPVSKPLWQIRLREGEKLEVLGAVDRQQYELDEKQPDWIQIEPPAGEFRWIAASDIEAVTPRDSTAVDAAAAVPDAPPQVSQPDPLDERPDGVRPFEQWSSVEASDRWSLQVETQAAGRPQSQPSSTNSIPDASGWKPAQQTIANFVDERSGFIAESAIKGFDSGDYANPDPSMDSGMRSGIFDAEDTPGTFPVSQASTSQNAALLTPDFGMSALQTLEMRLTEEMLKPPGQWNLMPLAAELQRLRAGLFNPQDQEVANRIMEKIRRCREIQAGYRATGDESGRADLQTRQIPAVANPPGLTQNGGSQGLFYNYDAEGYLNELVRDGGLGRPTFVLQDETGRVTHHIDAPPGLNLRRYLNQRVGIIGSRGFHQQLQLNHVTAERIIALNTLRR